MTEDIIKILRINGDPASLTIEQLRDNIKKLKEDLSKLSIGTDEYQSTLTSLIINQNALRNAMNGTTASLEDVATSANGTANSYNGLVARIAELNKEFRNLDLNSESGQKRMRELGAEINAVNDQLKAMDALRGNYQRNVGNYRSALNGLNNATAQVVRELPALAISAKTFFLAISNNIPILADQIANLRAQNEAAIAKGEKGVSVIKALLKSFLSWNTVLTLVITAVTLFGDKVIEFVGNLFKAKKAIDVNAEALKEYQNAINEARKAEAEAVVTSQLLYDIATDETRSMEDRLSAVRQLQDEYPDYLGNMSEEAILAGSAKDAYDRLTDSLIENARAKAYLSTITEKQGEIVAIEIKRAEALDKLEAAQTRYNNAIAGLEKGKEEGKMSTELQYFVQSAEAASKQIIELNEEIADYNDQISVIDQTIQNLSKNIPVNYVTNNETTKGNGGTDGQPEDNTLDYIRQMQDAQLALLGDGYEKQLAERKLYYERQIEDLKNTLETEENLTEEGRAAINETIRALNEQWLQEEKEIMQEWAQSQKDYYQEAIDGIIEDNLQLEKELEREEARQQKQKEKDWQQGRDNRYQMNQSQLDRIDEKTSHDVTMNSADTSMPEGWKAWKEYDIIKEANEKKLELMKSFADEALEAGDMTAALDWQKQQADLSVAIEEDAEEEKLRIKKAAQQQAQALVGNTANLLNTLADMYEEDAENNEKAAQQAKNLRVASATIETIAGAVAAYMQAQDLGPIAGPIVGAVQAAVVLATGLAQIQKIKNTDVNKDKSSSGSVGSISASVSAPTVTPRVEEVRNITSASEEDRLNRMADDQRVYILSSDIEASQRQTRTRVKESTF